MCSSSVLAILHSDGLYRGDRWRYDVWGYVAVSMQSTETLSQEFTADSFVWSIVSPVSRYPSASWLEPLIEAQMNINFTKNNIYVIFQNMLLFASILVACFCIVFGLALRGPSAAEKSERKQQRRYQRLTPLLTTLNTSGL